MFIRIPIKGYGALLQHICVIFLEWRIAIGDEFTPNKLAKRAPAKNRRAENQSSKCAIVERVFSLPPSVIKSIKCLSGYHL